MTAVLTTRLVFPDQTNHHGTLFGGEALSMMASAGAIAATRRARNPVVVANSSSMDFVAPVPLGWIVEARADVQRVGRSSLTVKTTLDAEDPLTGERIHASNGGFVFVAVDETGRPTPAGVAVDPPADDAGTVAGPGHAETTELVLPGATTPAGKLFGGELMRLLDVIAFIAATRQAHTTLVTARTERTDFHAAVEIGEALTLRAHVARARGRWVEVEVDATAENPVTGESRPCTRASFLFAAPRAST